MNYSGKHSSEFADFWINKSRSNVFQGIFFLSLSQLLYPLQSSFLVRDYHKDSWTQWSSAHHCWACCKFTAYARVWQKTWSKIPSSLLWSLISLEIYLPRSFILFQNGETLCSKLRPKSSFYPVIGSQYADRVESGAAFALFLLVAISNGLECLTEILWWGEGRKESRKREGNCQ